MSISFNPTSLRQSHHPLHHEAMTVSYKDHSSLSYGLITPPSEMRTADLGSTNAVMDSHNTLAPVSGSRYNLRKQPPSQPSLYPGVASSTHPSNYNSYQLSRRRSGSTSTTATSSTATSVTYRPPSPSFDIDSRVFNVGEFTATMACFLWFEPWSVLEYVETYGEQVAHLQPLADNSIPSTEFIEFCTQVIRTTAVSREVALLGLLFIHRLRQKVPDVQGKSGSQWRIFTIALMLGNKILDDNTYTNKTWADVTKILDVQNIKVMEVEFLSQMRYNLFVSPQQWEEWKSFLSRLVIYHREGLRQRNIPRKAFQPSIPPSPPVSSAATSPSFSEQLQYMPMPSSPYRLQFPQPSNSERMSSPHHILPPLDDSPSSASAAIHARVSRKRSRENSVPSGSQPPAKRSQQQYNPGPLGIQMPIPQARMHYPTEPVHHQIPSHYPKQTVPQSRTSLTLSLPENTLHQSPSYPVSQQYSLQPTSPLFPTSPYAASPISPYSTASNYTALSPYAGIPHRQMQSTPQPSDTPQGAGYISGFSSPYRYMQNRFSPFAPVRPVRTLPSQLVPPRMHWNMVQPPEELWYQPLGLHGHSGLRRGIPAYTEYNPGYQYQQQQNENQGQR